MTGARAAHEDDDGGQAGQSLSDGRAPTARDTPEGENRPRVLMCVFNNIEFDGRVQRSARSLATNFDVELIALDSGREYSDPTYQIEHLRVSRRGSKYWTHIWFGLRLCWRAVRRRPVILYAHDYFMAFPGWVAARLSGARFVYDAHEIMFAGPGERLARRERIWVALERAVIRRADLVVAANAERADIMREHFRLRRTPEVIRNIAAPSPCALGEEEVLARYPALRRRVADELLVVYQGDMSFLRGIAIFLDAAAHFPPNVRLVLVGGGPDSAEIVRRIEGSQALRDRISAIGLVPRDHLCEILRVCDIGLISYPMQGLNNIYCAPNKIFEYAQAGLPVVTTPQPPLRTALERYGIGEVVEARPAEPDAALAWATAIARVAADYSRYHERLTAFLDDHGWTDDHHALLRRLAEDGAG